MDVVYPVTDASLPSANGGQHIVRRGQHWPVEDAVVKEHPEMFSSDPRYGLSFSTPPASMSEPPVEQATAAPGERRARRG